MRPRHCALSEFLCHRNHKRHSLLLFKPLSFGEIWYGTIDNIHFSSFLSVLSFVVPSFVGLYLLDCSFNFLTFFPCYFVSSFFALLSGKFFQLYIPLLLLN